MQQYGNLALRDFTIDFDTPLPSPPEFKHRYCQNIGSLWLFTYSAYNIQTPDTTTCARRGCMIIVLVERTLLSLLNVLEDATRANTVVATLGLAMAAMSFPHMAWCLAVLGEFDDQINIHGLQLTRVHLDLFLWTMGVSYLVMLLAFFKGFAGLLLSFSLLFTWIVIALVAHIVGKMRRQGVPFERSDEQRAFILDVDGLDVRGPMDHLV